MVDAPVRPDWFRAFVGGGPGSVPFPASVGLGQMNRAEQKSVDLDFRQLLDETEGGAFPARLVVVCSRAMSARNSRLKWAAFWCCGSGQRCTSGSTAFTRLLIWSRRA